MSLNSKSLPLYPHKQSSKIRNALVVISHIIKALGDPVRLLCQENMDIMQKIQTQKWGKFAASQKNDTTVQEEIILFLKLQKVSGDHTVKWEI